MSFKQSRSRKPRSWWIIVDIYLAVVLLLAAAGTAIEI